MGCPELKASYAERVTAAEAKWFALGPRLDAIVADMEKVKTKWGAGTFCYDQAQALINSLAQWRGQNGPVAITLIGNADGAVKQIDCSQPPTVYQTFLDQASSQVEALENWVEARDQEVGTFEAQAAQVKTNCPVPANPNPGGPGGGD